MSNTPANNNEEYWAGRREEADKYRKLVHDPKVPDSVRENARSALASGKEL